MGAVPNTDLEKYSKVPEGEGADVEPLKKAGIEELTGTEEDATPQPEEKKEA